MHKIRVLRKKHLIYFSITLLIVYYIDVGYSCVCKEHCANITTTQESSVYADNNNLFII